MSDTRSIQRLPVGPLVDQGGYPTPEFVLFLNTLVFGGGDNTIGQQVSGIAEAKKEAQAAQASVDAVSFNTSDPSSVLTVTSSVVRVDGVRSGAGLVTTPSVTLTISGGTAPYTVAWSVASGDTFTPTDDDGETTAFTKTITSGEYALAIMQALVTDSDASPNTKTVQITATASDSTGIAP